VKFAISKRARRQIEKISAWWIENRPAAPSMFVDELADAERVLRGNPEAGTIYATHPTGVVRRVLLTGTKHHLYYRYRADQNEIVVLTAWGAPRERGPKL
jgi:plasmid stabilization system protein ParE